MINKSNERHIIISDLRKLLNEKWPDTTLNPKAPSCKNRLKISVLNSFIPNQSLLYGQIIEITGKLGSGRTSIVWKIIRDISENENIVYIDTTELFFPPAIMNIGVNYENFFFAQSEDLSRAVLNTELILRKRIAKAVVIDTMDECKMIAPALLHRMRLQAINSNGMVIFLTGLNSSILPSSTVGLKLRIEKKNEVKQRLIVVKSRLCREGMEAELNNG
ncbi:MAG: hypothetical protein GF315_08565 [candidate division Zixibacteria bacterium]|nr:hypothetical protein [candidate division Zixibacteria bacterium]